MKCERCGKEADDCKKVYLEISHSERYQSGRGWYRKWGYRDGDEQILACLTCRLIIDADHRLQQAKGDMEDYQFEKDEMIARYEKRRKDQARAEKKMLNAKDREMEKAQKNIEHYEHLLQATMQRQEVEAINKEK